jgi:SAM-dependent methyltransferase
MIRNNDIKKIIVNDKNWYKKIWTLDIQDMSWVEQTKSQVDFIWNVLKLNGTERILDLACGFGRHSLELAKRGCSVVGIDITQEYINEAKRVAQNEKIDIAYFCKDIREVKYQDEFDVVLNMADGAIGYLENDEENEKIFETASNSLKKGGKHFIDICNGDYARKHFPVRNWVFGNNSLSLADFEWDNENSIMYYGGIDFKYDEAIDKPKEIYCNPIRLYSLKELERIYTKYGMNIDLSFSDFDINTKATDDTFQMQVYSTKK